MLTVEGDREPFKLASVTKVLTATATLVAVEEGIVGLDDELDGRTVRALLSHADGNRRVYSPMKAFDAIAAHVAAHAAMPFAEYLREAVLQPLGMGSTTLGRAAGTSGRSTVDDMLRLGRELLAPTLLAPETMAEATSVQFPGLRGVVPGFGRQDPNDWGLGFELRDHKSPHWTGTRNSPRTFGHFGKTGTFLWVDPEAGLTCVALTDREFEQWAKDAWPAFSDEVLATYAPSSSDGSMA